MNSPDAISRRANAPCGSGAPGQMRQQPVQRLEPKRRPSPANHTQRRTSPRSSKPLVTKTRGAQALERSTRDRTNKPVQNLETSAVHVVVRIRPRLPAERDEEDGVEALPDLRTVVVSDECERKRRFLVDQVVDSRAVEIDTQTTFFNRVGAGFVDIALQGYNICLFAYGHTGSGKTYTMMGGGRSLQPRITGEGMGLLPRFLHKFHEELIAAQCEAHYCLEFLEIYNEQIRDLLAPADEVGQHRTRAVHVHPKHGVRVDGVQPSVVTDMNQALELVRFGNQMRSVSATTMNHRSSRSHAIFTLRVQHTGGIPGSDRQGSPAASKARQSTVTFVDLAGREDRTVSLNGGLQFREMVHINSSLFHLAGVVRKLAEGSIPPGSLADFRNSKLTLLLSQALAGNSRTALIATVAPIAAFYDDTVSTLAFAQDAGRIQTTPIVNNKRPRDIIAELQAEVQQLRQALTKAQTKSAGEKDEQLSTAEALLSEYQRSWGDVKQQSQLLQCSRLEAAKRLGLAGTPREVGRPFLTNLSEDPSLQGVCNYFIGEEPLKIGSSPEHCGMVVLGLGCDAVMAQIECTSSKEVSIQLISNDGAIPRVLVNGVALAPGRPQRLADQTTLIFGYSRYYRLIVPTSGVPTTAESSDIAPISERVDLDIQSAIMEVTDTEGEQFKAARPFLRDLNARVPKRAFQAFVRALQRICPLVDEANVITRQVRKDEGLRFELQVLTEFFDFEHAEPDLVVCLIWTPSTQPSSSSMRALRQPSGNRGDASSSAGRRRALSGSISFFSESWTPLVQNMGLEDQMTVGTAGDLLVNVWTLEKFLGRLSRIRELYEEGALAQDEFRSMRQQIRKQPNSDPWHDASLALSSSELPVDEQLPAGARQRSFTQMLKAATGSALGGSAAVDPLTRQSSLASTMVAVAEDATEAAGPSESFHASDGRSAPRESQNAATVPVAPTLETTPSKASQTTTPISGEVSESSSMHRVKLEHETAALRLELARLQQRENYAAEFYRKVASLVEFERMRDVDPRDVAALVENFRGRIGEEHESRSTSWMRPQANAGIYEPVARLPQRCFSSVSIDGEHKSSSTSWVRPQATAGVYEPVARLPQRCLSSASMDRCRSDTFLPITPPLCRSVGSTAAEAVRQHSQPLHRSTLAPSFAWQQVSTHRSWSSHQSVGSSCSRLSEMVEPVQRSTAVVRSQSAGPNHFVKPCLYSPPPPMRSPQSPLIMRRESFSRSPSPPLTAAEQSGEARLVSIRVLPPRPKIAQAGLQKPTA